ncbi:MAG TPA: ATP-binding protein, partial [Caulobacteraceae bacterium]|nr:ATP-binding protein [Caulobacteraceae bacterium]
AAQALDLRPGAYVTFTVRDTGMGMSPETLKRATEPFFTTKGVTGTGLGLATAYAFARESGGHLAIASREGAGTAITLYLPRCRAQQRADVRLLEASNAR